MNVIKMITDMWKTKHEFTVVTKAFMIFISVAIVLAIIIIIWLYITFPLPEDATSRVLYMEQYVAVLQMMAIGIVVTLISVIIPIMLPEAQDRFERYKESRKAYSRAKTAVIYLPDKVVIADRKAALQLVEEAHQELHFAETFEQMIIDKDHLYWFKYPKLWVLYNYWQIVAVAKVLRKTDWDTMEDKDKLCEHLEGALDIVHSTFGRRGDKCKLHEWGLKDAKRSTKDDDFVKRDNCERKLESKIDNYLNTQNITGA